MTERHTPAATDGSATTSAAAALVVRELAAAVDVVHATGEVERRLADALASDRPQESTEHVLSRVALDLGLRVHRVRSDLGAALEASADRGPLAARSPRDGRWLVVQERRGQRVRRVWIDAAGRVDAAGWIRRRRLADELGGPEGPLEWLVVDPAMPCESAAAGMGPVHRLLALLRPDRTDLIVVFVFAATVGVLLLATPIAVQALVNFVALGGAIPPLLVVALLLFLGLAFAGVLTALQGWIVEMLQRRVFVRAVSDLAARLPRVSLSAFDRSYGPELVNRFFDVVTIQKVSANLLLDGLGIVLSVLVGLAVLAFYHPLLLAFDVLLVIAIASIVLGPLRRGITTATDESRAKYAIAGWLEEIARNPLPFKSSGSRQWVFERSDALARDYLAARQSHFRVVFGQVIGALVLQVVASTALLSIGGLLVIQGSLTLGQLVAAELIVTVVVGSVAKLGKHVESFYDLMAAVNKVGRLLDLPLERSGEAHTERRPEHDRGAALELRELASRRPDGRPLFDDVSLDLEPGQRLGVRGPSGSGKSTLVELLWGLREAHGGAIRIDGRDLRELDLDSLRGAVAVAAATGAVDGTVLENVRLHRPHVTDDAVRDALALVGLEGPVSRLPDGPRTRLTPGGRPLSEGEVRRLCLARAIASRPRLLVVDGLLDGPSDLGREDVVDRLFDADAPWTLVVVSNRPDVLARCDRVLHLSGDGAHFDPPADQAA